MTKTPLSYIEISKENLVHNIKCFRKIVKQGVKIAGVIKANAYGHGDKELVKILNKEVDYFQVNSIEELRNIRPFTKKPIFLFGYVCTQDIKEAILLNSILTVFDFEHLLLINENARDLHLKAKVHIAVDSYLGREGIMPNDVERFLIEIKKMKNIKIDGVYSHFANIEDTEDFSHAQKQIDTFKNVVDLFKKYGHKNIQTHISATSGVFMYEKWKGLNPIVRIGIGLYGLWPSVLIEKDWKKKINLKPILKWVTHVAQVKVLPKGHSVGYGLTYIAEKEIKIAVIPQGYSNGFPRSLSNNAEVLIKGKRAPVIGRVMMNMFVVDVSHIQNVQSFDEVVILGRQGKDAITAEEFALKSDTINYEVVTRISPLLPRIIK